MTRNIFMLMLVVLFAAAVPVVVLADSDMYSGASENDSSQALISAQSPNTVDADMWPASGPVETGAVPGDPTNDSYSPSDTHFNPFHPDVRQIDEGGGGN